MLQQYDKNSPQSIYEFALKLTGKSLDEVVDLPSDIENSKNRGQVGTFLEKYYFQHIPPSNSGPDFPSAGLELKVSGLHRNSKGDLQAKERLVLTMINFEKIVNESFETSSFYKKCNLMLCMFYEYAAQQPAQKQRFALDPLMFKIQDRDLATFKSDWEFIREKVRSGKAHEISEGDTFILGACRKGSGGTKEPLRTQPFSEIGAPARAFSLKQSYFNKVIQEHINGLAVAEKFASLTYEQQAHEIFSPYLGKKIEDIGNELTYPKIGSNQKGYNRILLRKILEASEKSIVDLDNDDIELKTVRLSKSGKVKEPMSFPAFDFIKILEEKWEDSKFFLKLEKKFLFAVFQEQFDGSETFVKLFYWNMPYQDKVEARKVWKDTVRRVRIDASNLPKSSENFVAHVRPKGADGKDKALTPQGTLHLKQCFWLNKSYIQEVIDAN